jgi:hypothetical protein
MICLIRVLIGLMVVLGWPCCAWSQPFLEGVAKDEVPLSVTQRHAPLPSQAWLDSVAPHARGQMKPEHGGLDRFGRPVWAHQVQRRQWKDTTLLFNGWVKLIAHETNPLDGDSTFVKDSSDAWLGANVRSRYQRYENGWLVEQVGYVGLGQVEHHFHMGCDGRNVGSQRMWYPNGQPYIDQFHDEDGLLHGPQWRWRSDGVLDRDDQFNHGVAVDAAGRPLPGDGKTIFFRQNGGC